MDSLTVLLSELYFLNTANALHQQILQRTVTLDTGLSQCVYARSINIRRLILLCGLDFSFPDFLEVR